MNEQKIRVAIKAECDRAGVGRDRQNMLYYTYVGIQRRYTHRPLDQDFLRVIAHSVEINNERGFRTTPATFLGISGGVEPEHLPAAMKSLIERFNNEMSLDAVERHNVDYIIKDFLAIHPFFDGNRRIAWLLRIWMLDQWDDPQPIPDYQ